MRFASRFLLALAAMLPAALTATEQAFPPTEVDVIEVKTLPASRLIKASTDDADYFASNGRLFRPLFRYISQNDIKMTSPVEANIEPGEMIFYLGADVADQEFASTAQVQVFTVPARTVLSVGMRGGYSEERFSAGVIALQAWLDGQLEWYATGPARGIYWNGPMTPWFLRRSEVHIPIAPTVKMPMAD